MGTFFSLYFLTILEIYYLEIYSTGQVKFDDIFMMPSKRKQYLRIKI